MASKLTVLVTAALVLMVGDHGWSIQSFLQLFNKWDSPSYITIALHGYPACVSCHEGYLLAFLPGFPILMRPVLALGADPLLAGIVENCLFEAVALYYIYRLVEYERDRSDARFAVWCVALAVYGVFLTTVYTESSFLACAAASLYYVRTSRNGAAIAAAIVACAIRLTGLVLIPTLMIEAFVRRRAVTRDLFLPLVAFLPLALYALYMSASAHDAWALLDANRLHFNHTFAPPWRGMFGAFQNYSDADTAGDRLIWGREVASGVVGFAAAVACVAWWFRGRMSPGIAAYCVLAWVMATSISFWLSVGRYELAMFPALIVLADLTKRVWIIRPLFVAASGAMMVWGTAIYTSGSWLQ